MSPNKLVEVIHLPSLNKLCVLYSGLHVIKPHLTETKRRIQLAAIALINDFRRKLAKCLANGCFPVFYGNNLLFAETNFSPFRFKLLPGFHSFFIK